jgi:hypothetical protein
MKSFEEFMNEEVSLKGSSGIPGEGDDRDEKKYLSDVERRARQRLGVPNEENPRFGPPRQTMQVGREMMEIMGKSMEFVRGNEDALEELAQRIIMQEYGSILDNVDLDIKIIRPGAVKDFMDEECEDCPQPSFQLLNDPEIKKEVDKRKIINNITQGEAKNTKRILAMPEVKAELKAILGEGQGEEAHRIWMRLTELADKMDWLIPVDIKGEMMEEQPQGLAGACSVKWPEAEENEDLAEKILKDLEGDDADIDNDSEDIQELLSTGNPIIKARGVDFPMLLHETVKGIYELIAAAGIPEDKRTAELVMMNTSTMDDEAEEFRYGPELASDIRDFVNEAPDVDKYENIREHFYGVLHALPADEFLDLVKGILLETPDARTKVDEMVGDVIKSIDEYELGESLPSSEYNEPEEQEQESDDNGDTVEPGKEKELSFEDEMKQKAIERESDYSRLSKREVQELIDDALDVGDFDKVRQLSEFLGEGKEIYLKEIERINESHSHVRKKK